MIIITGTSRGIGKALAELYLSQNKTVIGIGRTNAIAHANYRHITCDLSNNEEVENLVLPEINDSLIFIHNAGVLGNIGRFSEQFPYNHKEVMQVNFVSGVMLLNRLIEKAKHHKLSCVFISSGAGKRAIPSWSAYCASKAAVDLFLETVQAEENEKKNSNLRVYSFSPGVVDTVMQAQIRNSSAKDFSSVQRFKDLHEKGELIDPKFVAIRITKLLEVNPSTKVQWSVSDEY